MLPTAIVADEALWVKSWESLRDLCAEVVVDSKGAPNFENPIKAFDLFKAPMAKLQLALSTPRQLLLPLLSMLFARNLTPDALGAKDMPTRKPLRILGEHIPTNWTLELDVHQLVLLSRQCHLHGS